jgi:hypothetical protein
MIVDVQSVVDHDVKMGRKVLILKEYQYQLMVIAVTIRNKRWGLST